MKDLFREYTTVLRPQKSQAIFLGHEAALGPNGAKAELADLRSRQCRFTRRQAGAGDEAGWSAVDDTSGSLAATRAQ